MGFIALFGFAAFILSVTAASGLAAALVVKISKFTTLRSKSIAFIAVFCITAALAWLIPNFDNLHQQATMNMVSKDCGSKEYKRVAQVEGIYIEPPAGYPVEIAAGSYADSYPAIEYTGYGGEIRRITRIHQERRPEQIIQRTFRYGFRIKQESVSMNIIRSSNTVLDFDTQDVLAEDISYAFKNSPSLSMQTLLTAFFTYHPTGCGRRGPREQEIWNRSILQPKEPLSPEQYAKMSSPPAVDTPLEVLDSEEFRPEKVLSSEAWSQIAFDSKHNAACKELIRPEFSRSELYLFLRDPTERKRTKSSAGFQYCEPDAIWLGRYVVGSDRSKMVIEKYSITGELIYKVSFRKPDELGNYLGGIMGPTFQSSAGYLSFEWWNSNQSGMERHINRKLKVRLKEP